MRHRFMLAALTVLAVALGTTAAATPSPAPPVHAAGAPASHHHHTRFSSGFVCDGAGGGDCASLPAGSTASASDKLTMVGMTSGAWRWASFYSGSHVGANTFTYQPMDHQLAGDQIDYFELTACVGTCDLCMHNASGTVDVQICAGSTAPQEWVYDAGAHEYINVQRANSKDGWQVLCNGGNGMVIITDRSTCTTYHEQWLYEV